MPEEPPLPRVLFVDDEPELCAFAARALRGAYRVVSCSDAAAARAALDGGAEAVVSDLRLPGTDGIALLAWVAQAAPDAARLLWTGADDDPAVAAALAAGTIHACVPKPIDGVGLRAALDLARRR